MARFPFESTLTDQQGHIIASGTVTVSLTGTSTVATIYAASSGGSALTGGAITTGTDGSFSFWVDEADYARSQRFRLVLNGGAEFANRTLDDVTVFDGSGGIYPSFTIEETTDSTINGADPLLAMYANDTADLKLYLSEESGGTRVFLWPPATAVPTIPHTGAVPTFAVQGDLVVGDISTFSPSGNAWLVGERTTTGLAITDITHIMCAKEVAGTDTDGGATIDLYPVVGAATSDGIVELQAYGTGSGAYANSVLLSNRDTTDSVLRRWLMNSAGNIVPDVTAAENTTNKYSIGETGEAVKSIMLGAGAAAATGEGFVTTVLDLNTAAGAGSPGDTSENTLKTYTVPANTLSTAGDTIRFSCTYRCASRATTKQIQIKWGRSGTETVIADSTAIDMQGQQIVVEGYIFFTAAGSQTVYTKATTGSDAAAWSTSLIGGLNFSGASQDETQADLTIHTTITLANNGAAPALNDVIQDSMIIEYLRKA